jgi:hypothetical protein
MGMFIVGLMIAVIMLNNKIERLHKSHRDLRESYDVCLNILGLKECKKLLHIHMSHYRMALSFNGDCGITEVVPMLMNHLGLSVERTLPGLKIVERKKDTNKNCKHCKR